MNCEKLSISSDWENNNIQLIVALQVEQWKGRVGGYPRLGGWHWYYSEHSSVSWLFGPQRRWPCDPAEWEAHRSADLQAVCRNLRAKSWASKHARRHARAKGGHVAGSVRKNQHFRVLWMEWIWNIKQQHNASYSDAQFTFSASYAAFNFLKLYSASSVWREIKTEK